MSERSNYLKLRCEQLRAHAAVQRIHLADETRQLEARLLNVDRVINAVRSAARQPLLIAAGFGLLALLGPRRVVRVVGKCAVMLTTGSRMLRLMRRER